MTVFNIYSGQLLLLVFPDINRIKYFMLLITNKLLSVI